MIVCGAIGEALFLPMRSRLANQRNTHLGEGGTTTAKVIGDRQKRIHTLCAFLRQAGRAN